MTDFDALGPLAQKRRNIFATPEFLSLWWEHFGDGAELRFRSVPDVVLPLCVQRLGPLTMLRFLGHGAGDELGPVGDLVQGLEVLQTALAEERFDVFLGEQLPGKGRWSAALGTRPLRREASPVLHLPAGGWEEFLGGQSANFRAQARRKERKLGREHRLEYRLADASSLERDLDTLFALHRKRWTGRETTYGGREAFHRAFAELAFERGWLRVWVMEVDGEPAAAWHGFRFNGAESYYQAGRDPFWDRYSIGFVLLCHTIRAAAEDRMSEYRLLRGDEEFKFRFTEENPGLETVARAKGLRGRAVLAAATMLDRSGMGGPFFRRFAH